MIRIFTQLRLRRISTEPQVSFAKEPITLVMAFSAPNPTSSRAQGGRALEFHAVSFLQEPVAPLDAGTITSASAWCRALCLARTPDLTELRHTTLIRACISLALSSIQLLLVRYQPLPDTAPLRSLES
jgi:hypothetical protein